MTYSRNETTDEYVVCDCSTDNIKLNLPILTMPDGKHVACVTCFAELRDCPPARIADVIGAGLPH